MSPRLFAQALLATWLLSAAGCHKKADPPAPAPTPAPAPFTGTGSYKLDGRAVSCQVSAQVTTFTVLGGQQHNGLQLLLLTTPQPAAGAETLSLQFEKLTGQPAATYALTSIIYQPASPAVGASYDNNRSATLTETSSGVFAGTFRGSTFYAGSSVISDGVFSGARP